MDLKTALEECAFMWDWLAEHPEKEKEDFFLVHREKNYLHGCALCEYTKIEFIGGTFSVDCEKCPMWPAKPGHSIDSYEHYGCENWEDSAYREWRLAGGISDIDTREECARQIAKDARDLLRKLENGSQRGS